MAITKELLISKEEYDALVRAETMLDVILNTTGSYELENTVNTVRALLGVNVKKEAAENA